MIAALGLSLALLLPPAQTVAIVQGETVQIVTVESAKAEYNRLSKQKAPNQARLSALVNALGTLPDENPIICKGSRCMAGFRIAVQALP